MSLTLLTFSHCTCTFSRALTPPLLDSRISQDVDLVQQATDLVTLCLRADPSQRPSLQQIIAHPFLAVSNLAHVSGFGPGGACVDYLNRIPTHVLPVVHPGDFASLVSYPHASAGGAGTLPSALLP